MTHHSPQSLPWRDTAAVYGRITRALHWSLAALILWQFLSMGLKLIFGGGDERPAFLGVFVGSHQPVGMVIAVLMVLRIIWSIMNAGNRPDHGTGAMRIAAKAGHGLLYLAALIVPFTAILRAWGNTRAFAPFGFEIFPAREVAVEWTLSLAEWAHGPLAWVMFVMIIGHVVMVGVHEAMWKDGTLSRMAGRRALR